MIRVRVAAYDPDGNIVVGGATAGSMSTRTMRKRLRTHVAEKMGAKWHQLWLQGYRVKAIDNREGRQ